jgi:hypothetical protein
MAAISGTVGLEKSTTENYIKLLEAVFLIYRLPAWGTTLGSRVTRHPMCESGCAPDANAVSTARVDRCQISECTSPATPAGRSLASRSRLRRQTSQHCPWRWRE